MALPFPWVQVRGDRAFVSGHGPVEPDGELGRPLGKVGAEVSVEEAVALARKTGLAIHARSAVGLAELPMRIAVEIEAEVLIRP
jgi:enamine deaminase RidA (YjgF/YER057c/UK114 family)